mgnify:CR=1 FL=1
MGPAFWAPLIIGILMILQGMIPHAKALPHFRVSRMLGNQEAVLLFGIALLLIVVGVVLDTMKQLESQLMMRDYESFLK